MKKTKIILKKLAFLGITSFAVSMFQVSISQASMIYLGTVDDLGLGFGAVDNILTMQEGGGLDTGTEDGGVGWDGTAPGDVYYGDANTNSNKTATYSFDYLGIVDASQILLIFDPSEVMSDGIGQIQVDDLVLNIYHPDNDQNIVWDSGAFTPVNHSSGLFNPGLGGGDFIYGLDDTQAAALNTTLAGIGDFSLYRIGLDASVSLSDDGPDTWLIGRGPGNPVPEPSTMLLFGAGLIGLAGAISKKRK